MNAQDLNNAILESFKKYKQYGARSPEKLIPIHTYLGETLQSIFGDKYDVKYKNAVGDNATNTEVKVQGKYYNKDVDITVLRESIPVFCLGVKFVISNFKQNANNYFENMMGETANIQANKIAYAQIIILRQNAPYYQKDGTLKNIETIQKHHLHKYIKLALDCTQAHRPYASCIHMVDIKEYTKPYTLNLINISQILSSSDLITTFNSKMSYKNLLQEIQYIKTSLEIK